MRLSKFFLIALVLLFCFAGSDDYYQQDTGATGGVAACTTTVASNATSNQSFNAFDGAIHGNTVNTDAGYSICGIKVKIAASGVNGGTRTLTFRIGTGVDLSSSYNEGTLQVTSADDDTTVQIDLVSPITGASTYYWGVTADGSGFANRVVLEEEDAAGYSGNVSDWILSSGFGGDLVYELLRQ